MGTRIAASHAPPDLAAQRRPEIGTAVITTLAIVGVRMAASTLARGLRADLTCPSGMDHERNAAIAKAAEAFIRAHVELEGLALAIGAEEASKSELNARVVALHVHLECLVLGPAGSRLERILGLDISGTLLS